MYICENKSIQLSFKPLPQHRAHQHPCCHTGHLCPPPYPHSSSYSILNMPFIFAVSKPD